MSHTKIAYRTHGEGEILILLHGYAGSVLQWDDVAKNLENKFKVIVPNLTHLFMGREEWNFTKQIDMFADFLRFEFPYQKVNLAGISYGGALAWGLALRHPEMIKKTIFINPMPPAPTQAFNIPVLKSFFSLPMNVRSIYMVLRTPIGRFFLKRMTEVFRMERADLMERLDGVHGRKLLFICHVIHKFSWILRNENWHLWKLRLETWTHPSLLIFDEEDSLFAKKTYLKFQDLIGCEETFKLHDAGHIAISTQPEIIAKRIIEFFQVKEKKTKKAG